MTEDEHIAEQIFIKSMGEKLWNSKSQDMKDRYIKVYINALEYARNKESNTIVEQVEKE